MPIKVEHVCRQGSRQGTKQGNLGERRHRAFQAQGLIVSNRLYVGEEALRHHARRAMFSYAFCIVSEQSDELLLSNDQRQDNFFRVEIHCVAVYLR